MIDKTKFDKVFLHAVEVIRKHAPVKTGNLKHNAIKYKWLNDHQFEIKINVGDVEQFVENGRYEQGIAPYTPFTNEVWISPRWNGKKNPNEGWWNSAVVDAINVIARSLGGKLDKK